MSFIRGGLVVIASVLLFLCFLAGSLFFTMSNSLEYENVHKELAPLVKDLTENEFDITKIINKKFELMASHCQNNSEYVFSEEGHTFVVPCEVVALSSDAVIEDQTNAFIEEEYYKDYDCSFLDCFDEIEAPFFLVSEKAKNYWQERFYLTLIAIVILIILIFLLIENKTNLPILVGILLIIASLPFTKLHLFLSFLANKSFLSFLPILVSKSYTVFLLGCILGLIILGIGIILKFFKLGFKIAALFSKKGKETSKKDEKIPKEKKISKKEHPKTKKKESK